MEQLFFLIAVIIAAFIERWRIKATFGKQANINHKITVAIIAAFWMIIVIVCRLYTWRLPVFAIACVGIRGVIWDPLLNVLRGLKWDYESDTTSSWTDQHEKVSFIKQRIAYFLIWAISGIVWEFVK